MVHRSYDRRVALLGERGKALLRLQRCTRGAVSVEYLIVIAVLGLSLALILLALGREASQTWAYSRRVLYGASP